MIEWLKSGYNSLKAIVAAGAILASAVGGVSYIATVNDVKAAEERVNKKIELTYEVMRLKTLDDQSRQYDLILRKDPKDTEAKAAKAAVDKEKKETLDRVVKAK
jgi:hypothetical protein